MATFENVGLALQLVHNLHGLVHNMRDNALGYKRAVVDGKLLSEISEVMVKDANQYLRRMQWMVDAVLRNQAGVSNALAALNLTLSEANQIKNTLKATAEHTIAALLTTGVEITIESDYILANVPDYERIF